LREYPPRKKKTSLARIYKKKKGKAGGEKKNRGKKVV